MPTAILLGTGTSNGVPMVGHHYPLGYLDNPKNHRTRSSLLLRGPSGNVLVDCAPEMRLQLTGQGIFDLEGVLITHGHADHVMGMDDLRSLCMKAARPMPVYARPETQRDIRRIYPYAFEEPPPGLFFPRFDLRDIEPELRLAGLKLRTFVVDHGPTKVVGLRVNDFAYMTDVSYVPPESEAVLQGVDTLVVDGLRYAPHPNHFSLDQAVEFGRHVGAKRTVLTHLTHDYDHDVTNASLPTGVELGFDGMVISI